MRTRPTRLFNTAQLTPRDEAKAAFRAAWNEWAARLGPEHVTRAPAGRRTATRWAQGVGGQGHNATLRELPGGIASSGTNTINVSGTSSANNIGIIQGQFQSGTNGSPFNIVAGGSDDTLSLVQPTIACNYIMRVL